MPSVFSKTVKFTGEPRNFSQFRNKITNVIICQKGTKTTRAHAIILAEASPFIATLLSFQTGHWPSTARRTFEKFDANARKLQLRRLPDFVN